jgi:predicted ABC-type ATPase
VGLSNPALSIARVETRVAEGGHKVDKEKLLERFPRTQRAIRLASDVANATVLLDNSLELKNAFSVCRIQMGNEEVFDLRQSEPPPAAAILEWLDVVCPIALPV